MATYRRSYLFRLASDPVCHLWTGVGLLWTDGDDIDPSGALWKGAGQLIDMPSVKQLINGAADRYDFKVSGVSAETLRLALEDRDSVYLADTRIGRVEFDADWQIVGGIIWEWVGIADIIQTQSDPTEKGRVRSISLSVASGDTRRSDANLAFFTDADQRKRSPDDAIYSNSGRITIGVTRRFGPK